SPGSWPSAGPAFPSTSAPSTTAPGRARRNVRPRASSQAEATDMRAALPLVVASLLAACGLPLSDGIQRIENRCTTDDDCGASGVCIEARCVAKEAALDGLVVLVEVPSQVSYGGGARHVLRGADLGVPLQGVRES